MNKYYDDILRLSVEMSLFMCEGGRTISEVAEGLGIDCSVIRNDVIQLLTFDDMRGMLSICEDYDLTKDEEALSETLTQYFEIRDDDGEANVRKQIRRKIEGTTEEGLRKGKYKDGTRYGIKSGLFDNTHFILNDTYMNCSVSALDEYMLVLTGDEYTHLEEFLLTKDIKLSSMDSLFKVKNSIEMTVEDAGLKYSIIDRIQDGKGIRFLYKGKDDGTYRTVRVVPEKICYNADSGFMYLIDSDGYNYRFDRIKDRKIYDLSKDEEPDTKKKISRETFDVKVVIRKKEGYDNLIAKIKEDVKRRNTDLEYNVEEHFTEETDCYIYTDTLDEEGRFKSWIYSYGSSVVVEEPKWLRDKIVESYKVRAGYYQNR